MTNAAPTVRIRQLPCFTGEVHCQPLSGGITNHNYRVTAANGDFVVRFCEDLAHLGIYRRNEAVCQRTAALADVAPEVVYEAEGVLVSRFLPAPTCSTADLCSPAVMERTVVSLQTLHAARAKLQGEMLYFCAFQTVRTYAATAQRLGAELPDDLDSLLAAAGRLQDAMRPFQPTLCHNDLLAANLLDDGQRMWLIDWEYAGIGNRLFDLANYAVNGGLSPEQERRLLTTYGLTPDPPTLQDLHALKVVSLLREVLWALIQTAKSTIDFDYHEYARSHLVLYRQALAKLA